jgi:hypothetical protein
VVKMIKRGLIIFQAAAASTCFAQNLPVPDNAGSKGPDSPFVVSFESIDVPQMRIVLFRTEGENCALQIKDFGIIAKGKEAQFADYEIYRFPTRNSRLASNEVGRFSLRGYFTLGHWAWEKGNTVWKCGGHRIGWYYPNKFSFARNPGLAVAPTAWIRFSDVRFDAVGLMWFEEHSTTERKNVILPISTLPGYGAQSRGQ